MNAEQALSPEAEHLKQQLHDIYVPDPVGWWPLAPGWWIVLGLVIAGLVFAITYFLLRHRRNAYRRQAIAMVLSLQPQCDSQYSEAISSLLKRTALTAYPNHHEQIAGLYGASWVDWLNGATTKPCFDRTLHIALSEGIYRPGIEFDPQALQRCAVEWIAEHKPGVPLPTIRKMPTPPLETSRV